MTRIVSRASAWRVPTIAAITGVAVGTLGGLIGLGGAEFRLPILVAVFGYGLRRAVGLNLGISLVTVLAGVTSRMVLGHASVAPSLVSAVGFPMAVGGMLGAYGGSSWLARVRDSTLHRATRWLLFGIDVKPAGTLSLLISIPTVMVGLWQQRAGVLVAEGYLGSLVVPMAVGSIVGAVFGGLLVAVTVAAVLKVILGGALMGSALRVFAPQESPAGR